MSEFYSQVKIFYFAIAITLSAMLISCNNSEIKKYTDTPTSGEITISCDASYEPLMGVEVDTFMQLYKNAIIHVNYKPESHVFDDLMNDSVKVIVTGRELSDNEKEYFRQKQLVPRTTKVAIDAVALIVNADNNDTLIKYSEVNDLLNGRLSRWNQLKSSDKGAQADSIIIVFDNENSCSTHYLKDKFLKGRSFPLNCFAVKTNPQVIAYVKTHKNALGVIGLNWISDKDDPTANKFLDSLRVVEVAPPDTSKDAGQYFKPCQAYIALKQYPLIHNVYMISREGRNGLGTGFAAFVAGDAGQRIIRLMGMLPATVPIRLVNAHR